MPKILLIEDDHDLSDSVASWLRSERYIVETAENGRDGLDLLNLQTFDLVILDWQLPEVQGVDVLKRFRASGGKTTVLMLTGKTAINDKTTGLDSGADDYLTKPVNLEELSARVRALMRRHHQDSAAITVGEITLDPLSRKTTVGGAEIKLLPKEFDVLEFFMKHADQVFTAEALLRRVWGSSNSSVDAVFTCIKRLRQKLDASNSERFISTIHGVGYKLVRPQS